MLHEGYMDTSTAKVGDLVRGDYIMEIVNCLPPASDSYACTQLGEPYGHCADENGKWRPTFLTWHLSERNGNAWSHETLWKFDGVCFRGENENKRKEFEL